jgi:hypothetical protein
MICCWFLFFIFFAVVVVVVVLGDLKQLFKKTGHVVFER